jgi:dienelactone hydrolase
MATTKRHPAKAFTHGHPSKENTTQLHLSPSIHHRQVMKRAERTLEYAGGDLKTWQRKLRSKVRQVAGEMPVEKCPLNVRTLWLMDHPLGTIEKIVYTSEPFSDVTAFVCLPKDVKPPYTWFVCVQGHSTGAHNSIGVDRDDNSKIIQVEGDRDFGLGCMRRGIAALCIEQRSFGERREQVQGHISSHGCHDATMHALMLGRTLTGERVYDIDRGIDYLATRSDVRMKHIGVMGNSGGGTVSLFAAALLPRLRYAMPSCYFCTFEASLMSIYHCMDNYFPGLLKYAEMPDVMGLFAPQPTVLVAGKEDPIFPVSGVRKAYKRLREIYKAADADDRCHLVIGPEGHRFYADLAWPKMLKEIKKDQRKKG